MANPRNTIQSFSVSGSCHVVFVAYRQVAESVEKRVQEVMNLERGAVFQAFEDGFKDSDFTAGVARLTEVVRISKAMLKAPFYAHGSEVAKFA